MLLKFIISLFFSTAETRIPLQPAQDWIGALYDLIYHKQTQSSCFIACVFALFPNGHIAHIIL